MGRQYSRNRPSVYYSFSLAKQSKFSSLKKFEKYAVKKIESEFSQESKLKLILFGIFQRFLEVKKRHSIPPKLIKLVKYIVRADYFGTNSNRKRFCVVVNRILTQSRYECIHKEVLYKDYDLSSIKWLNYKYEKDQKELLLKSNTFLLDNVVKPLIRTFYMPLPDHKSHKIHMYPKNDWRSFRRKIINKLISSGHMKQIPKDDAKKYNSVGILRLLPKNDLKELKYRPILLLKDKRYFPNINKKLDDLVINLRKSYGMSEKNRLFEQWLKYVKETEGKKIYGIKLDLEDAYGNVDVKMLREFIENEDFLPEEKDTIFRKLNGQYITCGKKLYLWKHGVLQGDRLSSRLCNLYLTLFERNLSAYFKPWCVYHREVDDILFCSTNVDDVYNFEIDMILLHRISQHKTVLYTKSDHNENITYMGKIFNMETKEVMNFFSYKKGTELRHHFKFWKQYEEREAHGRDWYMFLNSPLEWLYTKARFTKFQFNLHFNSPRTFIKNLYEAMCYLAFKADAALRAIDYILNDLTRNDYSFLIARYVKTVVRKHCTVLNSHVAYAYKNNLVKSKARITYGLMLCVSYKAFMVVFQKRLPFYRRARLNILHGLLKYRRLNLKEFHIPPKYFHVLPDCFNNLAMKRKSEI